MLAMGSWHDEASPLTSFPAIAEWEEMKLLYPKIPLTIAGFDHTRHYISADAPAPFDAALASFLAGRVIAEPPTSHLRTIPRLSVSGTAGATVSIAYVQPSVNGR